MDEMPSSEFRRRYASLRTPVKVMALGRPIGMWIPSVVGDDAPPVLKGELVYKTEEPSFNTRPFTPVPKGK